MAPVKIARVAVFIAGYGFDKPYDYVVSPALKDKALAGCRVKVPFGRGNKKTTGIILSLHETTSRKKIKPVLEVLDKEPVLNGELLKLALWLKEHTFCTVFEAAKAMLPAGLNLRFVTSYAIKEGITAERIEALDGDAKLMAQYMFKSKATVERERLLEVMGLSQDSDLPDLLCKKGFLVRIDNAVRRVGDATEKMVRLAVSIEQAEAFLASKCTPKQGAVVGLLLDVGAASVKEICYFTGVTRAVVNTLEKKGIVEVFEHERFRSPVNENAIYENASKFELTEQQKKVFDALLSQYKSGYGEKKVNASLLFGITGSGKTQVYMRLIDEVISQGRQVIVMVPEILLTPQILSLFLSRYGSRVAVMHSGLSLGQRLDEWKRIKKGDAQIVVGTRSAVFAPFSDIGLIIMDEEQEYAYKSDSSPRYHAREVARFRAAYHKALLLLCSATPSIDTYYRAQQGYYSLNKLTTRYGNATLAKVETVDMRKELKEGNKSIISRALYKALLENLDQGYQSILLLNRRGYNTFVICNSCGYVVTCPKCSISLTYHLANNRLMCHYCGFSRSMSNICPECLEPQVRYAGHGTQRLEQELKELLPGARILRLDTDTTMSRFAHEKKIKMFSNNEYDIMLGTQMVAKGLDFPNVTLVGVLSADQSLYDYDFRSYERTFSLLTQVAGRSGRGDRQGRAIIQTMTPDSEIISLAAQQNYELFFENEISFRRAMIYPPFCDIIVVGFVSQDQDRCYKASQAFFEQLKNRASQGGIKMIILGPVAARIAKVSNRYRYKLIIKCRNKKSIREFLSSLLSDFYNNKAHKNVTAFIDINPDEII